MEARWQAQRGEKGDAGQRGQRGEPGTARLSPKVSRALVVLFLLPSLIAVTAVIGVVLDQRSQRAQQARQGQAVERKLCATFGELAALKPPPGDPSKNPSRAYLQAEHATLVRLGTDLGCNGARP